MIKTWLSSVSTKVRFKSKKKIMIWNNTTNFRQYLFLQDNDDRRKDKLVATVSCFNKNEVGKNQWHWKLETGGWGKETFLTDKEARESCEAWLKKNFNY